MRVAGSLHEAFTVGAAAHPDGVAASAGDSQLSYGELDRRSTLLAQELRQAGVGLEVRVGLCVDRGIEMIVGMLGILKSGGAYVPIDPDYPPQRIQYIVEDSAMTAVVASRCTAACVGSCRVPIVDVRTVAQGRGTDESRRVDRVSRRGLAYVIYTSGSTGQPKGVLIEHGSVLRLFERTRDLFEFDGADVWAQFHSISFDFSVWEIWGPLLSGGRVVVVPSRIARAPKEFLSLTERQQITVLNQTPSAFRLFSQAALRTGRTGTSIRLVIFGGEALPIRMLEPWFGWYGDQRPVLVNMYGITETTVHVTYKRLTARQLEEKDSVIGIPIDDLEVHLLDRRGEPVAPGTAGRLCVSGPGVARGYLNRPALTAQRFFPHVDSEGRATRAYDSGDLAVRLSSGELAYLGRSDDQIKVRGYRIEPREVECCLTGHPAVVAAVVMAETFGPDATGLVAYVMLDPTQTPAEREQTVEELAKRARSALPVHLQPSEYRVVSCLPLTPHGKVDRQSLAARAGDEMPGRRAETLKGPQSMSERRL